MATKPKNRTAYDARELKPPKSDRDREDDSDKLLAYVENRRRQSQDVTKKELVPQIERMRGAVDSANAGQDTAYNNQLARAAETGQGLDQLAIDQGALAGGANAKDAGALAGYLGETNPLMTMLKGQGYGADVAFDPAGLAAQQDALAKYKGLSEQTGPNANDRFAMLQSRMVAEQEQRAAQGAVMGDLQARGMAGSGAQLTNMLGTQQQIGQDRVLRDAAMNANASDRSMTALAGYSSAADNLRQSNDIVGMFNKQQSQIAGQHQDRVAQDEATRTGKLAGERIDQTEASTAEGYGRDQDTLKARDYAIGQKYGIGQDSDAALIGKGEAGVQGEQGLYGAKTNYVGHRVGINDSGTAAYSGASTAAAGTRSAEEAAQLLAKKSPLNRLTFGLLG
jgi:hypothetical protein